ncbi:MAG: VOC family protein [Chloroflexi bacterium]|nr:VOC family protein [Chloroflexota bacterium]
MQRTPIEQQITFLYTKDLAATADFYERLLGLALWRDQGDCRIYQVAGNGLLGFCLRLDAPKCPQGIILCLVTDDVDGWYETLKAQGVIFEKPPGLNPTYQIYHTFLRDPNGYLIEIQRFE